MIESVIREFESSATLLPHSTMRYENARLDILDLGNIKSEQFHVRFRSSQATIKLGWNPFNLLVRCLATVVFGCF